MPKRPKVKRDALEGADIFLLGSTLPDTAVTKKTRMQTENEPQLQKEAEHQEPVTPETIRSEQSQIISTVVAEPSELVLPQQPDSTATPQRAITTPVSEHVTVQQEKPMKKGRPKRLKRTYYLPPDVVQQIHHLWLARIPEDPEATTASKNEIVIELLKAGLASLTPPS